MLLIDIADPEWYRKYFECQLEATRNYCTDESECAEEFDISQLDPLKWKVLVYLSPASWLVLHTGSRSLCCTGFDPPQA